MLTALVALGGLHNMGQNAKDIEGKKSCYDASETNSSLYFHQVKLRLYPNDSVFVHPTIILPKKRED